MALHFLSPKSGALSLNGITSCAFQTFRVGESYAIDDVTAYGANVYGAAVSNGTPIMTLSITGFAQAGTNSATLGFGDTDSDGGSCTITAETGCTFTGNFVYSGRTLDHSRLRGAVGFSADLRNSGDVTTTWATS